MRGEFVDLGGARVYCYAFGSRGVGDPIVLIHGAFTSSHLWQDVLPRLPKGHRVLVLDLLGHGRSDPPRRESMTIAAHATRVIQLMDVMARFRHTAQFRRWRTDKKPTDCTYAQLEVVAPHELAQIFSASR